MKTIGGEREEQQRRKHILTIILIGSIVTLSILDFIILFYSIRERSAYTGVPFAAFSILPVFFIVLYILSRKGYSVLASYLLVFAYFTSNSYAAYRWGADLQAVILAYALIVIVTGVLLGTQFGFFMTSLIALFIIPLWYAQFDGIIDTEEKYPRAADALVFSVLYFLIMIVAWLSNREVEKSLVRAQTSEKALMKERDLLEITVEERTSELRREQFEKVHELNRFAEFGQLASGLFHDALNILNAVSLRTEGTDDASLKEANSTTQQIEKFMLAIRKQLDGNESPELFSLHESIDHVIQLLNYKANKEHVRIIFDDHLGKDIKYFGVPLKFHQVVMNLLTNAIESYESLPSSQDRKHWTVQITVALTDDMIAITVQDHGSGIPPEMHKKIFQPFFTTKDAKGIGIGLATVKKIIENDLRGTIEFESAPGEGTRFTVIFPRQYE